MVSSLTADDILRHPRYVEARAAHLDAMVKLFHADRFAMRMMSDAGVIMMRGFLVGFHVIYDEADPATWPTPGNIRQALVERRLASPRRIDDLLSQFRHAGYVKTVPLPIDRRSSLLVPTDRLMEHDHDHLAAYHLFLHVLCPEHRPYGWALTGSRSVHRAIRRAAMGDLPQALSALEQIPMLPFLSRDAGYLALLLVLRAQLLDTAGPTWTAMSNELHVSRSHLRSVFRTAQAAGLVHLHAGRGRSVEILPKLWDGYDRFLANVQAGQAAVAAVAFAELAGAQPKLPRAMPAVPAASKR